MTMNNIEIFTGPGCSYCDQAKAALKENGFDFIERDVSDDTVLAEFQERLPRVRSIPQIFADGNHVGGYEDLMRWLKSTS